MNKLRLARRVLMVLCPILLVLLAAAVSTTSPVVAVLVVLLGAVFAGMLLILERSLNAEHRQRWMLRRALECRIAELERVVRIDGPNGPQPTPATSDLDTYRHVAQVLSRIARMERALGMEPSGDGNRTMSKEQAR